MSGTTTVAGRILVVGGGITSAVTTYHLADKLTKVPNKLFRNMYLF